MTDSAINPSSREVEEALNTEKPIAPRLLPCPLLGHLPDKGEFTAGPYIAVSGAPDMPKFYAVVCPGCCSTAYDENKERVIKKWNTRTSPASTAPVVDENSVAFTAYNQAVEDAKDAILAEANGNSLMLPGTFINAIARKCTPHVYVSRLAAAATAAPQQLDDKQPCCWHCGVVLAYTPKLRCEDCPDECDIVNCDALGCADKLAEQHLDSWK